VAVVPAGERRDQRDTWNGFSNALSNAFEMVATTVIFVLLGLWIDGRTGTRPLFTVVLGLLAVIGLGARAFYTYREQIAREEEGKPWLHKNP
jgi:F0F1-type ATP synthase assembly protein I